MAISYDTSTDGGTTTGTSHSFNHTCSGNNRDLYVAVDTQTADNTDYVTGVTYNTVAMTRVDEFRSPGQGGSYLYRLLNPASGTNAVAISTSGSVAIHAVAASYKGVLQSALDTSGGNASDPNTTLTVNVTTTTDNCWLISSVGEKNGSSAVASAGTNTTARKVGTYVSIGDSNGAQTPAGSHGQTWNLDGATGLAVHVVAIKPAPEEAVQGFTYFM